MHVSIYKENNLNSSIWWCLVNYNSEKKSVSASWQQIRCELAMSYETKMPIQFQVLYTKGLYHRAGSLEWLWCDHIWTAVFSLGQNNYQKNVRKGSNLKCRNKDHKRSGGLMQEERWQELNILNLTKQWLSGDSVAAHKYLKSVNTKEGVKLFSVIGRM